MQIIIDGTEYTPRAKPYQCSLHDAISIKRRQLGLTRKDAARHCGVSEHALYNIEKELSCPKFDTVARIALGLGLDIHRLAETVTKNP